MERCRKPLAAQAASEAPKQGQQGAAKSGPEHLLLGAITPVVSAPTGPGPLPRISGRQNQPQIASDRQPLK